MKVALFISKSLQISVENQQNDRKCPRHLTDGFTTLMKEILRGQCLENNLF